MSRRKEITSLLLSATRTSSPVFRMLSRPGQVSEIIGQAQAAASKSRTEGEKPHSAIAWRVTFNVSREDE